MMAFSEALKRLSDDLLSTRDEIALPAAVATSCQVTPSLLQPSSLFTRIFREAENYVPNPCLHNFDSHDSTFSAVSLLLPQPDGTWGI